MAHEIRPFERSPAFASWVASFGWRVLAASGDPRLLESLGPLLVNIHKLPWGGPPYLRPRAPLPSVFSVYSSLVDLHAALFSRGVRLPAVC